MNPWESKHSPWKTQASFYSWLRGGLRLLWKRYPIKNGFKQERLVAVTKSQIIQYGLSQRTKKIGQCEMCSALFPASRLEVDHIIPAGTLKSMDDLQNFATHLLCDETNMRLVCKECHANITLAEKVGCSPSDAWKHKAVIEFKKLKSKKQIEEAQKLFGTPGKNAAERVAIYQQYIFTQCKTKPIEK